MHSPDTDEVLLVLTASPALESQLIDWLLGSEHVTGFSSGPIHGHGSRHDRLSVAEQVTGRQQRLQFQVQLTGAAAQAVLGALGRDLAGADLHYWLVPLIAAGHLEETHASTDSA
jgi:hypothetical protein